MGEMRVMGIEGDVKVIWDKNKDIEVMSAKEQFESLMEKGYVAFEVGVSGRKSSRKVEEFDADLEKLIMVPKIAGG